MLGAMSLREKVGQVVMPWLLGNYASFDSEEYDSLLAWVDDLSVGGVTISVGSPLEVATKLNVLQRRSKLPLLVAADLEWGTGMRLRGGTTFPVAMALGATGRELDAYELGRITALEARAVGIHMSFSPVADVNNNPANPVINTRSFGEDPEAAARLAAAYVRGASEHGLLTAVKHFPGHGDTDIDSHIALPVVSACWDRLDTLELIPFRAAIEAGVNAVMTAHVALPCIDEDKTLPATLSRTVMRSILRDSLRFEGLAITDALRMGAIVQQYGVGESAVRAFLAGSDVLLAPADVREAYEAMVAAVETGRVSRERLDQSVRRILELKREAGLFTHRSVSIDSVPLVVGRREFRATAREMAQRAITLVAEGPLEAFRRKRDRTALVLYGEEGNLSLGGRLAFQLRELGESVSSFRLYPASGPASYDSARAVIAANPRTVFAVGVRAVSGRGHLTLPDSLGALILATDSGMPTVVASLGSPYLLDALPGFSGAYLIAWSDTRFTEEALARALTGSAPITGRLPISLGDEYPVGSGLQLPAIEERAAVPDSAKLARVTAFLARQAEEGAFPGGVLLVGYKGRVAHVGAVGRYGLDDPRPVSDSTIYDLASLTKVIGLTTAAMMLVAEGRLKLDGAVQDYLPAFVGPGKERVTVRHLLTHTSGLEAWVPLHLSTPDRRAALERVNTSALQSEPGSRYVYSDLGAIVLTEIVEAVTGEPLDRFLESRLFGPLGMRDTRFRPPPELLSRIAPTEFDPWRGRMIRGEVHDENAAHLGGVSGHAGLFSTAPDLARFAFWLLDAYHDRLAPDAEPFLPARIVRAFTRKQPGPEGSTRALGWDTPNPEGGGSAGSMLSPLSFGHTGFTGTSIWIDPVKELVIVLLTNRVHPTRENRALLRLRGMVADSVVSALSQPRGR